MRPGVGATWSRSLAPAVYGLAPGQRRAPAAAAAAEIHTDRFVATPRGLLPRRRDRRTHLDELNGRPLKTQLSDRDADRSQRSSRWPGRSGSGLPGCFIVSATLIPFVVAGGFLVVAYNLELFGGRFHTDFWLAASWGGASSAHLVVGEHPVVRLR